MKITGAKAVVKCLLEQGVDTVFGYPGGMILPLYDALYDEPRIRQVLNFHEQGAAHAADGYARASGKVGVCIATSGPGATNLVTGLATAFMDSVPVVAITGQVDTALLGRDAFQEVDIMGVTMSVTKHNFQVKNPDKLVPTLELAFKVASSGRQGPVLVDVPRDIFGMLVDDEAKHTTGMSVSTGKGSLDALLPLVREAAEAIAVSERPVVVAGGGVVSANASDELRLFAERYRLPVVNTLMGLGSFPRTHAQSLGMTGMHGLEAANNAVYEADLVIAVGSRFGDRLTGNRHKYSKDKRVIHIDIDPAEIDKNVLCSIGLAGDMKSILKMLTECDAQNSVADWWAVIDGWKETYRASYNAQTLNMPWAMHRLAAATADQNAVFVTDVGQHQMWAAQNLTLKRPRTWLTSGGLGSMGFGLPAAMGAQIALGDSARVIHIAGDGGIKMTGNEYYTIAALGLPVISIIVNNAGLGMIRQLQRVFYRERYIASDLPHPMDFAMYARSFGIESADVRTPEEFSAALADALAARAPRVIVMEIAPDFVRPMMKAGADLNEFVDF